MQPPSLTDARGSHNEKRALPSVPFHSRAALPYFRPRSRIAELERQNEELEGLRISLVALNDNSESIQTTRYVDSKYNTFNTVKGDQCNYNITINNYPNPLQDSTTQPVVSGSVV